MTEVREPKGPLRGSTWCGPYSVAVIAETDYEAVKPLFQQRREITRGRRADGRRHGISSVSYHEVIWVLRRLGFYVRKPETYSNPARRPTLAQFVREYAPGPADTILIAVRGHFVVWKGHGLHDAVNGVGKPLKGWKGSRARVRAFWLVEGPF